MITNNIKLIIENIQLLEQAKILLEGELNQTFFNTVDKVIEGNLWVILMMKCSSI